MQFASLKSCRHHGGVTPVKGLKAYFSSHCPFFRVPMRLTGEVEKN